MDPRSSDRPSDVAQWIASARQGCGTSQDMLVAHCENYLRAVAAREVDAGLRPKVAASDLVQETLLRAQQQMHTFDGGSEAELRGWLRAILRNYMADVRRRFHADKRDVRREVGLKLQEDSTIRQQLGIAIDLETPGGLAVAREEIGQLRAALAKLPEGERQVIALRSWHKQSFADIGRQMNRSPDAARMMWTRTVRRLGDLMKASDAADT